MEITGELKTIAAALSIAMGAMFPALAIAWVGGRAMDAMGRNPEAAAPIFQGMLLACALAEAVAIYALIIGVLIVLVS